LSVFPEGLASAGAKGEKLLHSDLRQANVPFKTEVQEQNTSQGQATATPDALLVSPVTIHGHVVHWVEVKHCVIIPSLSIASKLEAFVEQMKKYCTAFGSGAVLWTSAAGFSSSIAAYLAENGVADVVHFTRSGTPDNAPSNFQKKKHNSHWTRPPRPYISSNPRSSATSLSTFQDPYAYLQDMPGGLNSFLGAYPSGYSAAYGSYPSSVYSSSSYSAVPQVSTPAQVSNPPMWYNRTPQLLF
jgi:hypothetical protein